MSNDKLGGRGELERGVEKMWGVGAVWGQMGCGGVDEAMGGGGKGRWSLGGSLLLRGGRFLENVARKTGHFL